MISDLPKYKSKFKAKGYICEKGLREDSEFTKLDQLLVQSICNPKRCVSQINSIYTLMNVQCPNPKLTSKILKTTNLNFFDNVQ